MHALIIGDVLVCRSGTTPEESHMIAAFGQSGKCSKLFSILQIESEILFLMTSCVLCLDGGRTWEGVWRACLERLHAQKSQANPATPTQSRSGI